MCISEIPQDGLFLTFMCNQSEHFGMFHIKRWIDDSLWERYYPGFESFSLDEQSEVGRGMKQSASGLLLCNWMEVRKIFIKYLYTSSTSPYHPSDALFSRDEYQSDAGNLPHMHMMISLNKSRIFFCDSVKRSPMCTRREWNTYITK